MCKNELGVGNILFVNHGYIGQLQKVFNSSVTSDTIKHQLFVDSCTEVDANSESTHVIRSSAKDPIMSSPCVL